MDYKETYEKFWREASDNTFEQYERNLVLPDFFPATSQSEKVVDIAGGSGIVSKWLQDRGYVVSLVEFSDTAVEQAGKRGVQKIFKNQVDAIGSLPFPDNYFDAAFFGDIIEHLFDPESSLREVRRVLKPGGRIIISCPNIAYWRFRMYYLLDGDFERIDVAKQKPWEQEHIRFFNVRILKEFLGKLSFEFVRSTGVNQIWHSRHFVKFSPNLFAHTLVAEFKNKK